MQPANYHKLLAQQINETLGEHPDLAPKIQELLQHINATYNTFDSETTSLVAKVKLKTDQLIASTSHAYSFLDSLNMGFILCDVSGEIVLTNEAVKNILSLKMSDTNDTQKPQTANTNWDLTTIDGLLQPEVQLKELILQCLTSSEVLEYKELNYGKRVLHLFIAPMVNELSTGEKQQIGAVLLVEDITEQKVLDRSKDDFLSMASHELRTPLTAIRGNASLIKKYYGARLPDKDTLEMIDDIHESSIRLIDIVNDFLDASALQQGKMQMNPEVFVIDEIVTSVVRELHTIAEAKHLAIVIEPSVSSAPSVRADKERIKQVVYNLIGNAVKFTDSGSVTISVYSDDEFVYTSVADTGKGIPPENQQLLFRKFQQASINMLTRDNTKGTGLGLYISKLIVERSGGTIGLESSEQGEGSTFTFSLPRTTVAAPAPES